MVLYGGQGDLEAPGDFFVLQAGADQAEHVSLPCGEVSALAGVSRRARWGRDPVSFGSGGQDPLQALNPLEHRTYDFLRARSPSLIDFVQEGWEVGEVGGAVEEPAGAELDPFQDLFLRAEPDRHDLESRESSPQDLEQGSRSVRVDPSIE